MGVGSGSAMTILVSLQHLIHPYRYICKTYNAYKLYTSSLFYNCIPKILKSSSNNFVMYSSFQNLLRFFNFEIKQGLELYLSFCDRIFIIDIDTRQSLGPCPRGSPRIPAFRTHRAISTSRTLPLFKRLARKRSKIYH